MKKHSDVNYENPEVVSSQEDDMPVGISLFVAFLLPIVIMLGILAGKSIYPFGDNSFLRTDMYHQYAPFFAEFARILKSGGSLTYSFEIGLGTNFVALFAYYLSSPLNWLVLLCPDSLIIEFMTYMIVFKIGLCGLTMAWYLHKKFHTGSLAISLFGICYAMCGYIAAYSWNIMWMDCLWLAPLVLLGMERLIREAKPALYVISLGLSILCNYYISIMICIYLVLYYLCDIFIQRDLNWKKFLHRGLQFAFYSILAGGFAAIMILPAALALKGTASADSSFPSSLTSYFSILEMIARHMTCVDVEIGLEHWPNVYSGVACFFLLPAYVVNPRIPAREKVGKIILAAIMLLSFSMNIPNYIWHGLHFPNSLPSRQSFLYTILLLSMAYEGLKSIRELTDKQLLGCLWGDIGFLLILQPIVTVSEIEFYCYYLTILFIAMYTLLIWLVRKEKMSSFAALCLALLLIVTETGSNMAVTSVTTTSRNEYWKNTENYRSLNQMADDMEEELFYRVEKSSRRTKNDAAWIGYKSASIFSSATEAGISDFYTLFGMEGNTNAYSFTGATPLMEALLDVKYRISTVEMDTSQLREYISWLDTTYLYHNMYTLPLGFMLPDDVSDYFDMFAGDPADAQNTFVSLTADTPPVLEEISTNFSGDSFTFELDDNGHVYVYVENSKIDDVTANIGGRKKTFSNVNRGYFLDLGNCFRGEEITVTDDDGHTMDATAYVFNEEAFIQWQKVIAAQSMTLTSFENTRSQTRMEGTVTAKDNGTLFLSIPYEEGWTILVDGEEVEPKLFINAFLSVFLPQGTHQIQLVYHTPGLIPGAMASGACAIAILVCLLFGALIRSLLNRRRRKKAEKRGKEEVTSENRRTAREEKAPSIPSSEEVQVPETLEVSGDKIPDPEVLNGEATNSEALNSDVLNLETLNPDISGQTVSKPAASEFEAVITRPRRTYGKHSRPLPEDTATSAEPGEVLLEDEEYLDISLDPE